MDDAIKLPRKIILVENDSVLRKILAQNLELYTGSEIIFKKDADDLVDYLKRDDNHADLIISENMSGDEYTILKIFYYVNSQKLGVPIILLGENPKLKGQVEQIPRNDWMSVIKCAAKLMKVTAESMVELEVPEYYPVISAILRSIESAPVNIYTKESEIYKLWFNENDRLDLVKVEDFILSGGRLAYVNNLDRLSFAKAINENLQSQLKTENDPQQLTYLAGEAFNSAATLLNQVGVNDLSVKAAKSTIEAMEKIARASPKLDDLMAILVRDQTSIAWRHSLMTAIVCHAIVEKMDWSNQEQANKLVFASFFHDICIPQDNLACIHSGGELFEADLDPTQKLKVERHAFAACELLQKVQGEPFGADNIILQHHGMPNGIGFPEDHLDNRITPLAIVFRVAEDYVHRLLSSEKPDSFHVLKALTMRYNKGQYQKSVEALRSCHPKLHS